MGSISTMAELTAGQNGDSTATATETSDDTSELPEVVEEIGADIDRVRAAREAYDDDSFEGIIGLAELIRDEGADVIVPAEDYRHSNGINRSLSKWGFDRGGSNVMAFRKQFYGASDGSDEGTHNYIQAQAREAGVNLPWYKVLFPTPHEDYDEDSVLVTENHDDFEEIGLPIDDGKQDSHIFVPAWYAERYAAHTNDEGVPLPPPEGEQTTLDDTEELQLPFDPEGMTVDELSDAVSDIDDYDALVALHTHERGNKNRKTAIKRLNQRMAALDKSGEGRYGGSDDDESDPISALIEAKGLDDTEAAAVRALLS